jgi:hypothetical protein
MEILKNFKVRHLINILLAIWVVIWLYFALFNWDIFIVKVNINLGFGIISSYPFLLFFLISLAILLSIRYLLHYTRMLRKAEEKEKNTKIKMQEKDIEILRLKEMMYKMQTSEYNKTTANIESLNKKMEEIAQQITSEKNKKSDEKNEKK